MDDKVLAFAQVMAVVMSSTAALVVIVLGARALWRLGTRPRPAMRTPDDTRLQALEQAVDAIAIEVERISEGQRFTVALLSERLPSRPLERSAELPLSRMPRGHDTPH
jgi:hypothetical protein